MAAIITEQFRKNSTDLLVQDMESGENLYYLGIGQQAVWDESTGSTETPPYPAGTPLDRVRVLENLQGLFKVGAPARMIPRNKIALGSKYKVYDPYDPTCFYENQTTGEKPCFVTDKDTDMIYLCIQKTAVATGVDESIVIGSTGNIPGFVGDEGFTPGVKSYDDGYTWAYLGRFDRYSSLNTSSFVSVPVGVNPELSVPGTSSAGTAGLLYGASILNGGNMYPPTVPAPNNGLTTYPTVNCRVEGSGLGGIHLDLEVPFNVVVDNTGKIISARVHDIQNLTPAYDGPNPTDVTGFIKAKIYLEEGLETYRSAQPGIIGPSPTQGQIRPSVMAAIAPIEGFGYRPYDTLPSWYIGLYVDTERAEYIPSGTEYRQVSLVRNPIEKNTEDFLSADYVQPLKYIASATFLGGLTGVGGDVEPGWVIKHTPGEVGADQVTVGIVSHVQKTSTNSGTPGVLLEEPRVYYRTDHKAWYSSITSNGTISFVSPDGETSYDETPVTEIVQGSGSGSVGAQEYEQGSGEVVFIDNRSPIVRDASQNEELKIIIQL
jgi:hypothetical protein